MRHKRHINTKANALWRPLASFPCLWTEVKHTLSSVIAALHSSEVCISPGISWKWSAALFWCCCGSIFGTGPPFIETQTCNSSTTLSNCTDGAEQCKTPHTQARMELFSQLVPPLTSCQRKGLFPLTFCL